VVNGLASLLVAACGGTNAPSGPQGVAYVHLSSFDAPCTATQPLHDIPTGCPSTNQRCAVDVMDDLPFTRAQATYAVEGASQFEGGNLLALAWQNADQSISRMQMDVGPNRGYGLTHFPYPAPSVVASGEAFNGLVAPPEGVQEAIGYVEWKDGVRVFGGTSVTSAILNYGALFTDVVGINGLPDPNSLFIHVAFDGVGPAGEKKCRVLGLHGLRDYERFNPFDPSWLDPNPTMMLGNDLSKWPPTFSGDAPPTSNLLAVGAAPDPGGPAPDLPRSSDPFAYMNGYFYYRGTPGGGAG
jgi:hypothetical protein